MMNIFGLLRKTTQKNKKSSSLDLRKTQSSPVIIIRNTPTNLKPILTNHSGVAPPPSTESTESKPVTIMKSTQHTTTTTIIEEEAGDEETATTTKVRNPASSNSSTSSSSPSEDIQQERKTQQQLALEKQETEALAERLREISADDMEVLLSMETQARMDHQAEQRERQQQINEDQKRQQQDHHHQTKRLKFALPETPSRESTPAQATQTSAAAAAAVLPVAPADEENQYTPIEKRWSLPEEAIRQDMKKKSKLATSALTSSKWTRYLLHPGKSDPASVHPSSGGGIDSSSTTTTSIDMSRKTELRYGCKVKLIRSPIKTTAYVRYIGPVHFAPGEWIGVELERAVGKTDGSVDGQRYFHTGAYRGSFLTKDELMLA
ncbi:unnamed protein product [Absidia cylindrospora]